MSFAPQNTYIGPLAPPHYAGPAPAPPVLTNVGPIQNTYIQTGPQASALAPPVFTNVGPHPVTTVCPSCRANIRTRVKSESTSKAHLYAFLLCFIGCWPCCLVPYFMDSCKNANHFCPSCGSFIGTYYT